MQPSLLNVERRACSLKHLYDFDKQRADILYSPELGVPEPKPGCWFACCPNAGAWLLLDPDPKAGAAGWEPAENKEVDDKDPKVGAFGWLEPWLWPNAGVWLTPNAGPAAGAEDPEPNTNEEVEPRKSKAEQKFEYNSELHRDKPAWEKQGGFCFWSLTLSQLLNEWHIYSQKKSEVA